MQVIFANLKKMVSFRKLGMKIKAKIADSIIARMLKAHMLDYFPAWFISMVRINNQNH